MISSDCKRIAAIHCQDDGDIGAVWTALDPGTDTIHLYDCCVFRREVAAVIAEGLNARGRWIPIAWEDSDKDMSDKLLDRGCNMLFEGYKDADTLSEVNSREIWERMRTGRFKTDKRLSEWLDEYKTFYRKDSQVPKTSHPLMSATRHAVANLDHAKRQSTKRRQNNYPNLAIL